MIVHHRPQDAGTATEYTMAMGRAEFVLLHELVRMKIFDLGPISDDSEIVSFFALLRVMDQEMNVTTVESIPLPETLQRISMFPPTQEPRPTPPPQRVGRSLRQKKSYKEFKEENP